MKSLMRTIHAGVYAERLRRLTDVFVPLLLSGDRVLDVGCGNGLLLRTLLDDPRCPAGVEGVGLERAPRGGEPVLVIEYQGGKFPFEDNTFDVVIVADVLHHEANEISLLKECARVSRRMVILKDHARDGLLAQARISLIDWAANSPYGVPCLYRYHSPSEWKAIFAEVGLDLTKEHHPLRLYPPGWEFAFGGRLQYVAELSVRDA